MTDFADLLSRSGMTLRELCSRYDIPYRTAQDWKAGRRKPPAYTLKLLKEVLDMKLADHQLPGGHAYQKLGDLEDGTLKSVRGIVISDSKFGPQPCLIADDGTYITLPGRYESYVEEVLEDEESMRELRAGMMVRKGSYEYAPGKITPTFEWVAESDFEELREALRR